MFGAIFSSLQVPVRFDIDIRKFAALTGVDRTRYLKKSTAIRQPMTVTQPAVLVDTNGVMFGWVLPELLDGEQHVCLRPLEHLKCLMS